MFILGLCWILELSLSSSLSEWNSSKIPMARNFVLYL